MTPKDKAIGLYCKYIDAYNDRNLQVSDYKFAKRCALIAVDELIESFNSIYDASIKNIEKYSSAKYGMKDYWQEVKQEIENL